MGDAVIYASPDGLVMATEGGINPDNREPIHPRSMARVLP